MTTSNIPNAGLGIDFLYNRHRDTVDQLQGAGTLACRRELSTSTISNSTPLHLIVDSPSESRSTSPLYSSDSGSRGNLYDSVIPPAPADLQTSTLTRHGTLLSTNAAPGRNAAELNSILGDSTSRLRPGASVLPVLGHPQPGEGTSLEQAKSRARVEVDIILDSNTCVQGGYLQGHVKINIRECARNEVQVMISGGKVRVIGFESISNERDRYPFYQCSSPLLTITATSDGHSAHDSYQDSEGFAQAIEGEHTIPFSMYLPISADYGVPKGSIKVQAGVAVRYIAMVSIKVKDPISDSRSIAHFYRDCEIWPRLNPSIMLAPAGIPLRAKTSDSRLPGSRRIDLTASIHRLHWIAGQQCFVKVFVANDSKKRIKSLAFALIRTTIVCKPEHHAGTLGCDHTLNYDACQTSTTQKQVAESVLELGRRGARGHASAKGWWVGVAPGEQLEFSHSITLPSDALSVIRSRLLEVDYSVKVTLSAGGALRATDIQVSLPIQIINFLSIDPPPSYPLPELHLNPPLTILDSPNGPSLDRTNKMRLTETYNPYGSHATVLESLAEVDEERLPTPGQELNISAEDHALEDAYGGIDYDSDDDVLPDEQEPSYLDSRDDLQGLTAYEDDADEVVPHILQVDPEFENAPRFSDLYYASVEEDLCLSSGSGAMEAHQNHSMTCSSQYQLGLVRRVQEYNMLQSELRPNSRPPSNWRPNPPKGSSSFQDRVQAKLTAAAGTSNSPLYTPFNASCTPQVFISSSSPKGAQRQDSNHAHDYASTLISSNSLAYHNRTALATLPMSESASSLPYTKSSAFCDGGSGSSRHLPTPPCISNLPSADCLILLGDVAAINSRTQNISSNITTPPCSASQVASDLYHTAKQPQIHLQAPVSKTDSDINSSRRDDARTGVSAPRPSLTVAREQAGGSLMGSTNSVKERIKELEERQRLLDLNGP